MIMLAVKHRCDWLWPSLDLDSLFFRESGKLIMSDGHGGTARPLFPRVSLIYLCGTISSR